MVESMTGFGAARRDVFKVEVRSVNHRFMDVTIRMPHSLAGYEMRLRNMVKEKFSRGKFDVTVAVTPEAMPCVKVNTGLAKEICSALSALKNDLSLQGDISIETLAGFRDMIISGDEDALYNEGELLIAFSEALAMLQDMRVAEGEALVQDILERLDSIEAMKDQLAELCPSAAAACRYRLAERLKELMAGKDYDENRLLQEAALMTEKADITEEITRFTAHAAQLRNILSGGDAIGRKTEFLLQELNREVNTIASKSGSYQISSLTVEIKAELEKMREQVQNIQ